MWIVLSLPVHTAGLPSELSLEQELEQVPASSLSPAAPLSVVYTLGFSKRFPLDSETQCLKTVSLRNPHLMENETSTQREEAASSRSCHTASRMAGGLLKPRGSDLSYGPMRKDSGYPGPRDALLLLLAKTNRSEEDK